MSSFVYIPGNSDYVTEDDLSQALDNYVTTNTYTGGLSGKVSKTGDVISGNLYASTGGINLGSSTGPFGNIYSTSLTNTNLSANEIVYANSSNTLASATVNSTNLSFSAGTLNTIQNIATSSSPLFIGLTIAGSITNSSLTQNALVYGTSASKLASATVNSTNLSFTGAILNTIQNIATSSNPTFTGMTLSGLTNNTLLCASGSNQIISANVNSTNLSFSGGVLNTVQNISTGANPTFNGINLSSINTTNVNLLGTDLSSAVISYDLGNSLQAYTVGSQHYVDAIQDIRFTASPLWVGLSLSGLTTNTLAYVNGYSQLSSVTLGNLSLTSGVLNTNFGSRFAELTSSTPNSQTWNASTIGTVSFPALVSNTFPSGILTLSFVGPSSFQPSTPLTQYDTFTNASAANITLLVNYTVPLAFGYDFIATMGAYIGYSTGTGRRYAQMSSINYESGHGTNENVLSASSVITLTPGQSFNIWYINQSSYPGSYGASANTASVQISQIA
jgi:hypothetical protein